MVGRMKWLIIRKMSRVRMRMSFVGQDKVVENSEDEGSEDEEKKGVWGG